MNSSRFEIVREREVGEGKGACVGTLKKSGGKASGSKAAASSMRTRLRERCFMRMQRQANTSLSAGRKSGGNRRWHQGMGPQTGSR
jgi:hypothetical protein